MSTAIVNDKSVLPLSARTGTTQEATIAEKAFSEWRSQGATDIRCPRCGGKFKFLTWSNAYRITCENLDMQVSVRG